jgi:hypothetical protein
VNVARIATRQIVAALRTSPHGSPMRIVRTVLLALLALFGVGTTSAAQFQYRVTQFDPFYQASAGYYSAGFTAHVLFQNINSYSDPSIVIFNSFTLDVSQRVVNFCRQLSVDYGCNMGLANRPDLAFGISGNVQTGDIRIGDGLADIFFYQSRPQEDSCAANCYRRYYWYDGVGVLGCQAPLPWARKYGGRTCDADGYDGQLSMDVRFLYPAPLSVSPLVFQQSDFNISAHNFVVPGPSVFVQPTPEPASWILMATGLGLVAATVRRRDRHVS